MNWWHKLTRRQRERLKQSVFGAAVFFIAFLIFFFFTSLADMRISPLAAFKIFGYPGNHRNYLLLVRDPGILNEDGGRVVLRGNIKFRHGIYTGIDFENLPEMPDATLSANFVVLEKLNSDFEPTPEMTKKTGRSLFWKFWNYRQYAQILSRGLQEKDVVISSDQITSVFPTSDFLGIALENETSIPSDHYLQKRFSYQIDLSSQNGAVVTLRIHLAHNGLDVFPLSETYIGKLRIAIPLDADVLKRDVDREFTETNEHIFEKNVELSPGQSIVYSYRYRLPRRFLENNRYKLFLWKQPSADWQYQVFTKTSEDYELSSSQLAVHEFTAEQHGDLKTDQYFDVSWGPTKKPLLLINAFLERRSEIILEFNRTLSGEEARDGLNYAIIDLNTVYPETTDQVLIRAVVFKEKTVRLKLNGVSYQPGEYYKVTIRNLRDKNAMKISPDPLEIELNQ